MRSSRTCVPQAAVQKIQQMILSGELAKGQKLPSQRLLSEQLKVSRASLREALSVLETLGLLRIEPGRGTSVTADDPVDRAPIDFWRFSSRYTPREVYQFRLLIESYAARLVATNVTDEQIAQLTQIVEDYKATTLQLDLVASSQKDFELHHMIMQLSQNRIFEDLHSNYRNIFLASQRLPMARHSRLWEPAVEHERLVEAIARRDPEGAEYYMRLHITRAADRVGVPLINLP